MNLRLDIQAQVVIVCAVALFLTDEVVQVQNATLPRLLAVFFFLFVDDLVLVRVQNDVFERYVGRILALIGHLLLLLLDHRFLANRVIDEVLVEHEPRIGHSSKLMKQLIYVLLLCFDVVSYASLKLTPHLDLRQ